jgi:hypothetical protein
MPRLQLATVSVGFHVSYAPTLMSLSHGACDLRGQNVLWCKGANTPQGQSLTPGTQRHSTKAVGQGKIQFCLCPLGP